jgi:hypothetical protein
MMNVKKMLDNNSKGNFFMINLKVTVESRLSLMILRITKRIKNTIKLIKRKYTVRFFGFMVN